MVSRGYLGKMCTFINSEGIDRYLRKDLLGSTQLLGAIPVVGIDMSELSTRCETVSLVTEELLERQRARVSHSRGWDRMGGERALAALSYSDSCCVGGFGV